MTPQQQADQRELIEAVVLGGSVILGFAAKCEDETLRTILNAVVAKMGRLVARVSKARVTF